jgi:release factor glutamine methyltransferase
MVARLRAAGCVFAEDEARLLLACASEEGQGEDGRDVDELVTRRCEGERLEHVLGWADFGGVRVQVEPGVFIPRPQTVALAQHAVSLQPRVHLDLFSGCGAIAAYVAQHVPDARVVACELHVTESLRANVSEVHESDVDAGVPAALAGQVDVLTANVPYVPTSELEYVPHDGERVDALDGGPDGLDWTRRLFAAAPRWLRAGGAVLTEVGEPQWDDARDVARDAGFEVGQSAVSGVRRRVVLAFFGGFAGVDSPREPERLIVDSSVPR